MTRSLLGLALGALVWAAGSASAADVLPLDQVKPGMKGVGRTVFEGTQPVFRQSPPILWRSTRVTLAFTAAAMYAVTRPADPAPITTTLRSKRAGFGHLA